MTEKALRSNQLNKMRISSESAYGSTARVIKGIAGVSHKKVP